MNVILFMTDSYRRDNLSCYGPFKAKTPRLDNFAKESVIFDNAYLGSFPTIPNRLDILSGRFTFTDNEWCPMPRETITLPQILGASGYTTFMVADNPHLLEDGFNYDKGFQAFEWIRGQESDRWRTDPKDVNVPLADGKNRSPFLMKQIIRAKSWWKGEEDRYSPRTIKEACSWLERNQDQDNFFLYLDLFDPHEPWDAPQKYLDLYENKPWTGHDLFYTRYAFWRDFLTQEELDHVRNLYLAEASMVDHWFGVLLDKLEELGMAEDTAIIFTSDHGYLFGEHDLTGKSMLIEVGDEMFYEAVPMWYDIRSQPLMIRMPGIPGGRHTKALVQSPDLFPTILEMAGLVSTDTINGIERIQALQCGVFATNDWKFEPEKIHGKSLMPLLRGEKTRHRDIAVSSNSIIHHTPILGKGTITTEDGWCLHYSGKYETIQAGGKMFISKLLDMTAGRSLSGLPKLSRIPVNPMLYYLPDDPTESKDLYSSNQALAKEIHQRYVRWLEEQGTPEEHLAERRNL
jgi:arylsulfatase A-like enzyme